MIDRTPRPPVIIIGMHRSGTSLITRLLEQLGVFFGWKKEKNHEALFFLQLNDWMLRQSGGAWDHPAPIRNLFRNREVRALVVDYARFLMDTPRVVSYLGLPGYLRYRFPGNLVVPWGWKDPRNTFTLPIWLELFPEARVIHIYRHGVDVAHSLLVRQEKALARLRESYQRRKLLYWLRPKYGAFTNTLRCASLDGGFSLWEEYVEEARSHVRTLGNRAVEVRYEDFLANPVSTLRFLAEFCGLSVTDMMIENVVGQIRVDRAYAYRSDRALRAFAEKVAQRLSKFGY